MKSKSKIKILLIQETDWILRGPHYHHHIFGRLNHDKYMIRIVDFPLIWDKQKRNLYPLFRNFHKIRCKNQINTIEFFDVYRPLFINLPILNIISIYFQRIVIKKQIQEFNPHIVICFASLLNVNYVIRQCKKNNIHFIYCLFEKYYTLVPFKGLQRISKILEDKAIKNSDKNIVLTKDFQDNLDKIVGKTEKNILIPQGVDLDRFNPNIIARDKKLKYGISDKDTVLFFMGWIYDFSGMREVVYDIAQTKNMNLKLIIVGEGGIYDELKKFVKKYNLENNVILTGWVPYKEIPEYISMADICLLPAYKNDVMKDIVPIKLFEYLAMSKPVIATRLPGIEKDFGENNGIIYIESPNQTVKKAMELKENSKIEGLKGRLFVENYDWKVITKTFENFIQSIL